MDDIKKKLKAYRKKELADIKGLAWIFYFFGWLIGFWNPLFWIILVGLHHTREFDEPLFNRNFHRRVSKWGLLWAIITGIPWVLFILSSL